MARTPNPSKLRLWQQRMARFRKSQQSICRFCQSEGISKPSFYFWRKRLQQVAPPAVEADSLASRFMPVRLLSSSVVSIRLPGGTQIDVSAADPQLLHLALHTLAQLDAQRAAEAKSC